MAYGNKPGLIRATYPSGVDLDAAIPERPREYLRQAIDSIHAPAGSIMLTASAVDSMLKARRYDTGTLYSRIDKAAADHVITPDMAKWAHEVRLEANDQRHSDPEASLPTEGDARRTIEFASTLADLLFVLPSRVSRGRERPNDATSG